MILKTWNQKKYYVLHVTSNLYLVCDGTKFHKLLSQIQENYTYMQCIIYHAYVLCVTTSMTNVRNIRPTGYFGQTEHNYKGKHAYQSKVSDITNRTTQQRVTVVSDTHSSISFACAVSLVIFPATHSIGLSCSICTVHCIHLPRLW